MAKTKYISIFVSIAIPLAILLYVVLANLFVTTQEVIINPSLSPADRIMIADNYTNLTTNLVYFNLPKADQYIIQVTLEDNFENDQELTLGAKNGQEWSYNFKSIIKEGMEFEGFNKINNTYIKNEPVRIIATDKEYKSLPNYPNDYNNKITEITTHLRGGHTLLVYAKDELYIKITKKDLNWYNGSDNVTIKIYNYETLIQEAIIPDDGITDESRISETEEYIEISQPVSEGIYRIQIGDFDGIITNVQVNSNKIVFKDRIFLANNNLYFEEKPSTVYFEAFNNQELSLWTWHSTGIQDIQLNDQIIKLSTNQEAILHKLTNNNYELTTPKSNVILEFPGYFALNKDHLFEPYQQRVTSLNNYEQADAIITDYIIPIKINNDYITTVTFDVIEDNLTLQDNQMSFVFNSLRINQKPIIIKEIKATIINEALI